MSKVGTIEAVCISDRKGIPKTPVEEIRLVQEHGVEADAHAGSDRQVSLLCRSSIDKMRALGLDVGPGAFAENLTIDGLTPEDLLLGTQLAIGAEVLVEVTQIGKECHTGCAIRQQTGKSGRFPMATGQAGRLERGINAQRRLLGDSLGDGGNYT